MARASVFAASALVALLCTALCAVAQLRPGCIQKYTCPQRTTRLCGVWKTCNVVSDWNQVDSYVVCDNCAYLPKFDAPEATCNFKYGRCMNNTIDGKTCKKGDKCGDPNFKCMPINGYGGVSIPHRCCRTTCPPGLCGTGNKTLNYRNLCGYTMNCPTNCPEEAARKK
ncbi:hypothetical protein CLOM_g19729 [Closterium sp. NIES-68]|nr:hypothetical protein CLOM_g19729 [Closterium sp. NIES-68]GJP59061.1 hypothetical protein CLOP_g7140 [Closterium sp. NIES-67]